MKKIFLFLFLMNSILSVAQDTSEYKYIIVPEKFDFLRDKNEHNLNELTKFLVAKKGVPAFFDTEDKPLEYNLVNNCDILKLNVSKEKSFLNTKLKITIRDCEGNIIAESTGESKEKSNRVAYNYALRNAFDILYLPTREISEKLRVVPSSDSEHLQEKDASYLYAKKTNQGYTVYDSEENEKYSLFKTSKSDQFIISNEKINGALYKGKNENEWFLEYLENNQVVKETLKIKF